MRLFSRLNCNMLFYSVVILLWIFTVGQLASIVINKLHLVILYGNVSVLDMIMENEICCIDPFKWATHLILTHIDTDACVEYFIIQLDLFNTGVSIVLWKKFVHCVLFFLPCFFLVVIFKMDFLYQTISYWYVFYLKFLSTISSIVHWLTSLWMVNRAIDGLHKVKHMISIRR